MCINDINNIDKSIRGRVIREQMRRDIMKGCRAAGCRTEGLIRHLGLTLKYLNVRKPPSQF